MSILLGVKNMKFLTTLRDYFFPVQKDFVLIHIDDIVVAYYFLDESTPQIDSSEEELNPMIYLHYS
jgi:hypothetical protein